MNEPGWNQEGTVLSLSLGKVCTRVGEGEDQGWEGGSRHS